MKPIKWRFAWNHPSKLLLYPRIRLIAPYTMMAYDALCQMVDVVDSVDRTKVAGALVETGCWKGGCGALMSWRSKQNKSNRPVWLFDSFEGIPELAPQDREWAQKSNLKMREAESGTLKPIGYYVASTSDVSAALRALDAGAQVQVVPGWFQDSLPRVKDSIGPIAVLRLDGDLYESTKCVLDALYDQVSIGGYVVIDDYHLEGCRKAVYEFFAERGISPYIMNAPRDGRAFFIKH